MRGPRLIALGQLPLPVGGLRSSRWRLGAVGLVAAGTVMVLGVSVAGAHATPLGFSPKPGSTVGGRIDAYEVLFDQRVVKLHSMGLSTEQGDELAGEWTQAAPNLIRFTPDSAPTESGNYIVSYKMTAEDGDTTRSAFVFTYDPEAAPPDSVPPDEVMSDAPPWGLAIAGGALLLVAIGLATRRLRHRGDPQAVDIQ